MQITFDTNSLSAVDLEVLALIAGMDAPKAEKASPAAKPAPQAGPKAKAAKAVEEPVEAVDEAVEDEPATDGPSMEDAVAAATKLVSTGQAPKVKAALTAAGAKRVSELTADKIADFIAALS